MRAPFFYLSAVLKTAERAAAFANWLFRARTKYAAHSPFLFEFAINVLEGETPPFCKIIEARRKGLARSAERFAYQNEGAGASGSYDFVATHARRSSARLAKGAFLHRFCRHHQPEYCLELGANLGVSAAHMLSGYAPAHFATVEADPRLCELARETLRGFGFRPSVVNAKFEEFLALDANQWDFVYLDGHHAFAPVMNMLRQLAPRMNEGGCILLDDIYWSRGMTRAWRAAQELEGVAISIDLFHAGLLVFRGGDPPAHYKLRKNFARLLAGRLIMRCFAP